MKLNRTERTPTEAEASTANRRQSFTPEEVAGVLKLHPVHTRRLFTRGLVPGAIRIGRVWRLPADALDIILEKGLPSVGGAR